MTSLLISSEIRDRIFKHIDNLDKVTKKNPEPVKISNEMKNELKKSMIVYAMCGPSPTSRYIEDIPNWVYLHMFDNFDCLINFKKIRHQPMRNVKGITTSMINSIIFYNKNRHRMRKMREKRERKRKREVKRERKRKRQVEQERLRQERLEQERLNQERLERERRERLEEEEEKKEEEKNPFESSKLVYDEKIGGFKLVIRKLKKENTVLKNENIHLKEDNTLLKNELKEVTNELKKEKLKNRFKWEYVMN